MAYEAKRVCHAVEKLTASQMGVSARLAVAYIAGDHRRLVVADGE
jgi:hypothetical protein